MTVPAILDAIRHGRGFISRSPAGPELYVNVVDPDLSMRIVGAAGAVVIVIADGKPFAAAPVANGDWRTAVPLPVTFHYLRVQVIDQYGNMLALSNALWAEVR